MKNFTLTLFLSLVSIFYLTANVTGKEKTPSFPGAEGFGRYTTGGRGGDVYHVTSIADDGSEGTFRWAVNKSGTRTIVFDVSGTIHLTSPLSISSGNLTIAGQSAPGDGICIADYPFTVSASNVIVRFIRVRLGNANVTLDGADGWDGFDGMEQTNLMIDHCSISWSIDEDCSFYGNTNSSVQWCIISQSLQDAGHSKGSHGYGGIFGGSGATFHHNLICHHGSRTPRLGPRPLTQKDERLDFRNNVIYNWGGLGCYGGEGMNVNIVNNYYKPGPATILRGTAVEQRIASIGIRTTAYCTSNPSFSPMLHTWGKFYVDGNVNTKHAEVTNDNWNYGIYNQISNVDNDDLYTQTTKDTMKLNNPIDFYCVTTHSANDAYSKVLDYAGSCINRDWLDTLMVSDTRNGMATFTGTSGKFSGDATNLPGIIDSQEDNRPENAGSGWSAWPLLNSLPKPTDSDQDGMPDAWETANGLNPDNSSDRNKLNSEGYTMLEVYLNSLVNHITTNENAGGTTSGFMEYVDYSAPTSITLNHTTYSGASGASSPWQFNDGFTIENSNGKTYSTGSEQTIKYSSGVAYTVRMPSTAIVDSITLTGYDNYSDVDAYLSQCNGTSYPSTGYVFVRKPSTNSYSMCTYTVPMGTPVTNSFAFKFDGSQVAMNIKLWIRTSTGISKNKANPILDPNGRTNVYGIDGKTIRANVIRKHATSGLRKGIYIVDNQKILIYSD